jgi:4-amino-4-deoxy-L-arabinose transferase-like glycosyltransferase
MRTKFLLWTIWCCFVARALFYCSAIPIWEGYDEYSHFALIQYVATHGGRFPLGEVPPNGSRAVSESRKLTPGSWIVHDARTGILSYEEYFSLPQSERQARRSRLESLPRAWSREDAVPPEPIYEAQQAPLYYWLMAPFYALAQAGSIPDILWLLRVLTMLIGSAVIPLTFVCARMILRSDAMALGSAAVAAAFPELLIMVGHLANDGLAMTLGGLSIFTALRMRERAPSLLSGIAFGLVLGAALLTKAYFLALIPLAAIVLWISGAVWPAIAAIVSSMAIAGWWYIRNLLVSGTLTGQLEDARAVAGSHTSLLHAAGHIPWTRVLDFIALSHIWLGNWSFLLLRTWMYRVIEIAMLAALAGIFIQAIRKREDLPQPKALGLLALPYATMLLGLGFHAAQVYRTTGTAGTLGYYLYALIVPEAILLVAGLARLVPARMRLQSIPVIVSLLLALELFGAWFVMFPYYSGIIRHTPSGGLPTAHLQDWIAGNAFDRLSGIAPASHPAVIFILAVLSILAAAVLLYLAYRITAGDHPELAG